MHYNFWNAQNYIEVIEMDFFILLLNYIHYAV